MSGQMPWDGIRRVLAGEGTPILGGTHVQLPDGTLDLGVERDPYRHLTKDEELTAAGARLLAEHHASYLLAKTLAPEVASLVLGPALEALHAALDELDDLKQVLGPEPHAHFVALEESGWSVEHALACRLLPSMLDCPTHKRVYELCHEGAPNPLGRYRVWWERDELRWAVVA